MIDDLVNSVIIIVGGVSGFAFLVAAYRLARGDIVEYERNRQRTPGILSVIQGRISPVFDGVRDYRVAAGLAVDLKSKKWVEQGRLSNEALTSVFRDPTA